MWSYYGSKSKVVHLYPPPKHQTLIEPFAGSARYALKYFDRDVILVDKYSIIVELWQWLQQCSENDILNLPTLKQNETVHEFGLTENQKRLLGFVIKGGDSSPANKAGSFDGCSVDAQKNQLKRIAKNLFKIKHWTIIHGSYQDLENQQATWFIDPPYQFGGEHYKESNKKLNFKELAQWCQSRNGQVIVCENTKADWLDFRPMSKMRGSIHTTTEAIWSNLPTNYDFEQTKLF